MKRNRAAIVVSASICVCAFLVVYSFIVGLPNAAMAQSTQDDSGSAPAASQTSEGEERPAAPAADAASDRKAAQVPESSSQNVVKAYLIRNADLRSVLGIVAAQYSTRAKRITTNEGEKLSADQGDQLVIYAPEDVHAEIRGLINYLDQPAPRAPAKTDTPAEALMRYFNPLGVQKSPYQQRLDVAITKLREAKNDDETQAAKTALRQLLAEVFSDDMQAREKQVQEIEGRLERLRKQYQERQQVKDEIVELQLKVLERESQGLGFPQLPFTDKGIATRKEDETLTLRSGLSKDRAVQHAAPTSAAEPAHRLARAPVTRQVNIAEYNEYIELRDQCSKAKTEWQRLENELNTMVVDASRKQSDVPIDELKKQHPAWGPVQESRRAWEDAQRLLNAKLTLLELDWKSARITHDAAADKFARLTELSKRNAVSQSEVDEHRAAVEAAQLEVERTNTLLELFKSISNVAPGASDSTSADGRDDGQPAGKPPTL